MKKNIVMANISWNSQCWKKPMINPFAKHRYTTKYPGHESLNFDFEKNRDSNSTIYGYVETNNSCFRQFEDGGVFIFYSNNTDDKKGQIVGIYGDVKTIHPRIESEHKDFENNILFSNLQAAKELSLHFPIYLDSSKYKKYSNNKRLCGQRGFSYYQNKNLIKEIIYDELMLLEENYNSYVSEINKLKKIYKYYIGEEIDYDKVEQEEIEQNLNSKPIIIDENCEEVIINGKSFKRDNVLISKIKEERGFKCQICNTKILKENGAYYIEAAHITPKRKKGTEKRENILVLCPNHHKEFDYGKKEIIKRNKEQIVFKLNDKKYKLSFV